MTEWQSHYKSLSSNPTLIFRHSDLILPPRNWPKPAVKLALSMTYLMSASENHETFNKCPPRGYQEPEMLPQFHQIQSNTNLGPWPNYITPWQLDLLLNRWEKQEKMLLKVQRTLKLCLSKFQERNEVLLKIHSELPLKYPYTAPFVHFYK